LRNYSEDQIISREPYQDGVERFEVRNPEHSDLNKHSTIQDYYKALGKGLSAYKVFITIRNPYDRMVSFYFSPHRGKRHFERDGFVQLIKTIPTIEEFTSIKKFFGKRELFPNIKFLRFEKLDEDFSLLLKELEIKDIELPHFNTSNHEKYKKYYDEETSKIVSDRHKYEISLGNYEF